MAAITQLRPHGALAGRRFASFVGKTAEGGGGGGAHPVSLLSQYRPHGALAGMRFGNFSGKTAEGGGSGGAHPVSLLTQFRPHGAFAGGRYGDFSGKSVDTPTAPAEPTDVAGTATSDTTATITWVDASGNELGFYVEVESPAGSGNWVSASGGANPTAPGVQTFSVTGLSPATTYTPGVQAYNGAGPSTFAEGPEFTTDNPGSGGGTIGDDDGQVVNHKRRRMPATVLPVRRNGPRLDMAGLAQILGEDTEDAMLVDAAQVLAMLFDAGALDV